MNADVNVMLENIIQNKYRIMTTDKCQFELKNPIKHPVCEEDYAWNPSICACNVIRIVRSMNN